MATAPPPCATPRRAWPRSPRCCSMKSTKARWTSCPTTTAPPQEPRQLPARLPFALLNGASGIAVGLATEIPSHNLREVADACVALVKDPQLSDEALLALIPGPDYPGGGQIISSAQDIAPRLPHRARQPEGARALDDRGAGARPVAVGGDAAAAGRVQRKRCWKRLKSCPTPRSRLAKRHSRKSSNSSRPRC